MQTKIWKRLAWFILLWSSSVATLALVAFLFKLLMIWAGFKV